MLPVLYFHGFASSPGSAKIAALRPLVEPHGIVLHTPDLNVPSFERLDFDAVVESAVAEAQRVMPRAMVGSSLGSLVALSVANKGIDVPMVLIAPALGVARRWSERLPETDPVVIFNHARSADAPIHRHFFMQMTVLHVDDEPPPSRVTAIMGRKDETVPFEMVEARWNEWVASGGLAAGSKLIVIEEGDHGLVEYAELIGAAIVEAAGL